ncbi:4-hydroxy-tetrahydrodipicolinate synthase [Microbacterium oxydans]|uniref:4-hydroxy-tetrahydrodipicolinate synthase n=1 Tax=Microbacterium oxydans TaxID=82380 RepID=A0A0F0L7I7_9MICO|nr:dihydrodipicolinate synthase family protein [Microbacterium oxydans]KJL29113.1 4-hydroxy-tetrahydrodipicolinate synthase [Microbacterium oxydans]CAH0231484.1 4-hydroxy-tetrahydrodipicolinate synthase [Microbacterium oxydans]
MFSGLNAFPHTPLRDESFDEAAFARLIERLLVAGVDSITALGSTGSYMYLDRDERRRVAEAAVRHAGDVPVMVGIGAIRTSHVQQLADDAQQAGAGAVLLAPVTYQRLGDDEVFGLFEAVTAGLSVPLAVYDNPGTTHVTFSDDLYARIATLPKVASIKIPGISADPVEASGRVEKLRTLLPSTVTIGISGDASAATGLNAGCDAWYSAIGGILPAPAVAITRAALSGDTDRASAGSARLLPLWTLFGEYGSYRVTAAIGEHLGLLAPDSLPRPVRGLDASGRARVERIIAELQLSD